MMVVEIEFIKNHGKRLKGSRLWVSPEDCNEMCAKGIAIVFTPPEKPAPYVPKLPPDADPIIAEKPKRGKVT